MNGGWTATRPALEYCRDSIFQTSKGMRQNSKRTILLLTDGHSNMGGKPGPVAQQLHVHPYDVAIYALGIGSYINVLELQEITKPRSQNNPLAFFIFTDFQEFFTIAGYVQDEVDGTGQCKAAKTILDKKKK